MKTLQKQWRKACNRVLGTVLVLLGFSACTNYLDDDDDPGKMICMYGVPSAQYNVKGKVIDADTKQAIPGIRVISGRIGISDGKEWLTYYPDTVYTDTKGKFETVRRDHPAEKYRFIWEDVDGESNGSYKKDSIDVDIKGKYINGEGYWYQGEKDINVTLKIKKNTSK